MAVRLNGVAAPELNEPVGQASKKFMFELVTGKAVRCELNGERTYDRVVGVCYLNDQDIGASIIAAGLARDCPRFSGGRNDAFNTAASKRLPLPCTANSVKSMFPRSSRLKPNRHYHASSLAIRSTNRFRQRRARFYAPPR